MNQKGALLSGVVYAAITLVIGRQVLQSLGSAIASDSGDPLLNAAILAWNAQQVPWTDGWFQLPIFHPTRDALTFSEHLLGVSLLSTPIYWLTGNPVTAYNLTLLLAYPLSGLAMYALVWRLTRQPAAAFLAGLAFAFAPYRAAHLPQIQVQMIFWAPLALLGLHEFVGVRLKPDATVGEDEVRLKPDATVGERGVRLQPDHRWRWLALYALAWLVQGASNGYYLIYFSFLVGLWLLWFVVARRRWRELAAVAAASVVASLPLVPILYRYLATQRELGLSRNLGEIASFGADIAGLLCAPPGLTFWGWLQVACGPEGELFPGTALAAICVMAGLTGHGVTKTRSELKASWFRASVARVAVGVASVFLVIAAATVVVGPWRVDLGVMRISASAFDKPLSTAVAFLLVAFLLSDTFRRSVARGSTATFYLGAAVICWVLAWGPFPRLFGVDVLYQAPFAWLLQVPGVDGLRVPARFWMMSVLCLTVFLGLVSARLLVRFPGRRLPALTAAAAVALLADGWTTVPAAAVPGGVPDAGVLRGRVVLSLPVDEIYSGVFSGYRAVAGGWRSINGYSGFKPGYYEALRILSDAADEALLAPFLESDDVHVLVDAASPALRRMVERQPGVQFRAEGPGMRQYRLPRRPRAPAAAALPGQRLEIRAVTASCDASGTAKAIDGDLATSWVCGAQRRDDAMTVDLGGARVAGSLLMALGPHGSGFPRDLIVDTSTDGNEWQVAWRGSPAALVLRAALESPRETRVALQFPPRDARYLRVRQVGRDDRFWSIAELEVFSGTR